MPKFKIKEITKVVDGVEQTFQTYERVPTEEEIELQKRISTINVNEHTRTLIYDPDFRRSAYFRFETNDELKTRIAKRNLGYEYKKHSWKELVILEMNKHYDDWDYVQKIQVKYSNSKRDENEGYPDPNEIERLFGIAWYDILHEYYRWSPTEEWKFCIWTIDRVYFPDEPDNTKDAFDLSPKSAYYVSSAPIGIGMFDFNKE